MGEKDPEMEAIRYAGTLKGQLPMEGPSPVFDWVWLGLGSDGHTASIFPEQIELWKSEAPCVVARHPQSGQHRISLTGSTINAAKRVSILTTGQEKSEVVKQILMKEGNYMEFPAFYVNPSSDHLEWYLDQDAASLL
jgi:6-phosphogluconolactonase